MIFIHNMSHLITLSRIDVNKERKTCLHNCKLICLSIEIKIFSKLKIKYKSVYVNNNVYQAMFTMFRHIIKLLRCNRWFIWVTNDLSEVLNDLLNAMRNNYCSCVTYILCVMTQKSVIEFLCCSSSLIDVYKLNEYGSCLLYLGKFVPKFEKEILLSNHLTFFVRNRILLFISIFFSLSFIAATWCIATLCYIRSD